MRLPRPANGHESRSSWCGVGATEAGRWWPLPVLGHHILIAGATGSGKGSVVWSLIAALAPAVRAGSVQLCVIDPKGGMEFGRGADVVRRVRLRQRRRRHSGCCARSLTVMQQRAARLRGRTRLHAPTVAEPLIVLIVDELASLTAYISDRKIRTEVEQLLGLLLSQGRAVGVSVVAAVQDPSKEVLPIRQLFTVRVGSADDRKQSNDDGAGRGRTRGRRGLRPDPHRHTGCGIRHGRRCDRTDPGARLPRHRRRHRLPHKAFHPSQASSPTRRHRREAAP